MGLVAPTGTISGLRRQYRVAFNPSNTHLNATTSAKDSWRLSGRAIDRKVAGAQSETDLVTDQRLPTHRGFDLDMVIDLSYAQCEYGDFSEALGPA